MTRRLRRMLALLPSAALGGAEAQTATLLRAVAATGVEVTIGMDPALVDRFAAVAGPGLAPWVRPAALGWDDALPIDVASARQRAAAAPLIAAVRPELALLPLPWPTHALGLQAALAAAAVPALVIAHLAPTAPEAAADAAARCTPRGPTVWGAVSAPVAARLARSFALPHTAVAVVRNGVAVPTPDASAIAAARAARRASLGLSASAPLVLAVGRLEPKKGADLLPPLAAALRARCGATLVALGLGPLGPVLAAHPAARGPTPALRLPGQAGDVGAWMWAADALVLPSRLEGCPLVFLEAAARRLAVVASAAALEAWGSAARELALVQDAPSVATLADALAGLLGAAATAERPPAGSPSAHPTALLAEFPTMGRRGGDAAVSARRAAAHAAAVAHDADAMDAAWLGLLRAAAA